MVIILVLPTCDNTYSRILGRIRIGQQTPDDITLLRTRLTSGIDTPVDVEQSPFTDALRLLPLKVMVDERIQYSPSSAVGADVDCVRIQG